MISILSRILVATRHRLRAAHTQAGFATPTLQEVPLSPKEEPLLASNTQGRLVETRVSTRRLVARFGFFTCPLDQEPSYLVQAYDDLLSCPLVPRATSVDEACKLLGSRGTEPQHVVAPSKMGTWERLHYHEAPLREGTALVLTTPPLVGHYTRIGDYVGILLLNVDLTICLVEAGP